MKLSLEKRTPRTNGKAPLAGAGRRVRRLDYRTRNLGLAALLGLSAVVLTLAYVHSYKGGVDRASAPATVFVAARDIEAGTPGSTLVAGKTLVAREVPSRAVVQGAISDRRQLSALIVAERIYAGEQITTRRFTSPAAAGIRGEVSGPVRAMAVSGDTRQLLAGVLQPGDRVDVVMAVRYRTAAGVERIASRVILRKLRVLSAPEAPTVSGKIGAGAGGGGMQVILAVTDRQAQKLFVAMQHDWTLALRPFGRSTDPKTLVDTSEGVLNGPVG